MSVTNPEIWFAISLVFFMIMWQSIQIDRLAKRIDATSEPEDDDL